MISISTFFNSYAGMYVAQAFCHSVIASVISDSALKAWRIADPVVRQRFRVIAIILPIFSFPLYQAIDPSRSMLLFRLGSIFDINQWLNMEFWGVAPFGIFFLFILGITSLIFLFQEIIPVMRHTIESNHSRPEGASSFSDPIIDQASRALSIETPEVITIDDKEPLIFSTTGKNPVIYISSGLVHALSLDEMRAAIAHEVAHISRSRRPLLLAVFVLRMIMFFNPVALVEFRRIVRNEEKICDDISVSLTHQPLALAETLKKFSPVRKNPEPDSRKRAIFTPVSLEEYSHNIQLDARILRLEQAAQKPENGRWLTLFFALLIILGINYLVV